MATIDQSLATSVTGPERTATPPEAEGRPRRRGFVFWIARYLPAEVAGTAAMVFGGLLASVWTTATPLIALAALVGEIVGFYTVLAVTIYVEQVPVTATRRRALGRTGVLLVAEFGAAELLDTFLVRPAALMLGIWLVPDPVWGMLLGKVAADAVFYAVAAGAFTITARTGLRDGRRTHRTTEALT
jgi:hypothetical protein